MTRSFYNSIAIVTGGASGIGRALCEELTRRGALAVVADIHAEGAQAVASAINATGGRATAALLDVTRAADVERLIEETVRTHGRLDYMFNKGLGVRVSVVCPGFVDTAIYENAIGVKVDKDKFLAKLPVRLMSAADAARAILRGVGRNEAIIVFPFYARLLWWLTRINPGVLAGFHRRMLANMRAMRLE